MSAATRTLPVRLLATSFALLALVALTGCTSSKGTASPSATGTSTSGASPASAAPTSGADASSNLEATPLSVACGTLVPAATVAIYTGMTADATPTAPAKSDASVIEADKGTVCSWTDASTGDTMSLAVGQYSDASLTRVKNNLVTASNQVPTYQGEGYFDLTGSTGTAEAFTGPYWIVAASDTAAFSEPGGAEPVVDAAIAALKARS